MRRSPELQRKHAVMWAAVGGTAAVIAALWVALLPTLLRTAHRASGEAARWGTAERQAAPAEKKTFAQIIEEQRLQLARIEANQQTGAPSSGPGDLLARIEAATVAKRVIRNAP